MSSNRSKGSSRKFENSSRYTPLKNKEEEAGVYGSLNEGGDEWFEPKRPLDRKFAPHTSSTLSIELRRGEETDENLSDLEGRTDNKSSSADEFGGRQNYYQVIN